MSAIALKSAVENYFGFTSYLRAIGWTHKGILRLGQPASYQVWFVQFQPFTFIFPIEH
jgi:hypothetical protein